MKKEDIEKGIKLFLETLRDDKVKIDYAEDVCYMRSIDGEFLDSSGQKDYVLGYVLLTEDPEKIALLDKMVNKLVEKRNIKFEDLGEVSTEE